MNDAGWKELKCIPLNSNSSSLEIDLDQKFISGLTIDPRPSDIFIESKFIESELIESELIDLKFKESKVLFQNLTVDLQINS